MTSHTQSIQPRSTLTHPQSGLLAQFKEELFSKVSNTSSISNILNAIEHWAGGDPYLTQLLCDRVLTYATELAEGNEVELLDALVQQTIIDDWENNDAAQHLHNIHTAVLNYPQKDALLIFYIQVLQRGAVPHCHSPEQEALTDIGLLVSAYEEVRIANAIYANIFDLDWVEQQLPGITRPVRIVRSQAESKHPSAVSKLYSKLTVAACGTAVVIAAGLTYLRGSTPPAMTTAKTPAVAAQTTSNTAKTASAGAVNSNVNSNSEVSSQPAAYGNNYSSRELFDQGLDHATNGRWLSMLREFCAISTSSTYFIPAERQLSRWLELYQDDVEIAQDTFIAEGNGTCPVANIGNQSGFDGTVDLDNYLEQPSDTEPLPTVAQESLSPVASPPITAFQGPPEREALPKQPFNEEPFTQNPSSQEPLEPQQ